MPIWMDSSPRTVATVVGSILSGWSVMDVLMGRDWCRHGLAQDMSRWSEAQAGLKFRWLWRP